MNQDELRKLVTKRRKAASDYADLVDEARKAGTPWSGLLATKCTYRQCALELERALEVMTANEEVK